MCHAHPEELLFLTLLLVCCECFPHWVIVTYVMPYASSRLYNPYAAFSGYLFKVLLQR